MTINLYIPVVVEQAFILVMGVLLVRAVWRWVVG